MKVTFIMPSVGRKDEGSYVKTWQMEPLCIGVLKSLTPPQIAVEFYDDRVEPINFDTHTDLVAITVETYTARRAYEISHRFQQHGAKVLLGGFHPTLLPEEARKHADSIAIGEVEELWTTILTDVEQGKLADIYQADKRPKLQNIFPDRSIFEGKKYLNVGLIETGRGCMFNCDFCSITSFYNHTYQHRAPRDIVQEIQEHRRKRYFFVDDNICADQERAKELFRSLVPLNISWLSQADVTIAQDSELLRLMKQSGCAGVLIGFESLNHSNLRSMKKGINIQTDLDNAIRSIHNAGLRIYATFVFGYDEDTPAAFEATFEFAMKHRFFLAAFNHLVPFPGTGVYDRLKLEERLLSDAWWLDHHYSFGDVAFQPKNFQPQELAGLCYEYRRKFYSASSVMRRMMQLQTNWASPSAAFMYFLVNWLMKRDVDKRQGLPMGMGSKIE